MELISLDHLKLLKNFQASSADFSMAKNEIRKNSLVVERSTLPSKSVGSTVSVYPSKEK